MVLRVPSTVSDQSLLQDEPFKTRFAQRRTAREGRKCSTNQRSKFYVEIEEDMRKGRRGFDAAEAWVKTVFGKDVALNSTLTDAFVDYFWLLHIGSKEYELNTHLCKVSKEFGLPTFATITATITAGNVRSQLPSAPSQSRKAVRHERKRAKRTVDVYDAEVEDNGILPAISATEAATAPLPAVAPKSTRARARPISASATVTKGKRKKRKAKKDQPSVSSSSSASSSEDNPPPPPEPLVVTVTPNPVSFSCLDSDSPLTPVDSDEDEAALTAPLQSFSNPVLPFHNSESSLTSILSDAEKVFSPALLPTTPLVPPRHRPIRSASKRAELSKMMQIETRYNSLRARGRDVEIDCLSSQPSASAPLFPMRSKKGRFMRNTKVAQGASISEHNFTRNSSSCPAQKPPQPATVDSVEPAAQAPATQSASVRTKQVPSRDKSTSLRKGAKSGKPSTKKASQAPQGRPSKKSKSSDGSPLLVPAVLVPETVESQISAPALLSNNEHCSSVASEAIAAPSNNPRDHLRKRLFTEMSADPAPASAPPGPVQRQRKPRRKVRPIPLAKAIRAGKRVDCASAPPFAEPALGMSPTDVDAVIRGSVVEAQLTLSCTADVASEWEVRNPDEGQHVESSESEEEVETVSRRRKPSRLERPPLMIRIPARNKQRVFEPCSGASSVIGTFVQGDTQQPPRNSLMASADSLVSVVPELPMPPKLPLPAYPPIWAQSRQEVCETFEPFRSYQGGVYFTKNVAKGYLLSAFSASRDIFHNGGKVIISHGGGKAESLHKTNGQIQTHSASDQQEGDKSVRALLETQRLKYPIALLIDDKYALFPYDLGSKDCTYAVLGWYYIAHAWAEYQPATNTEGKVVRYKFAFHWCEGQGEPWWSRFNPVPEAVTPVAPPLATNIRRKCTSCKHASPQVYHEGWMCLKPKCSKFWKMSGTVVVPNRLNYSQAFLNSKDIFTHALTDIRPMHPVEANDFPQDGITTSEHFCKGWHCRDCGRLSSRYKWEDWECRACGSRYSVKGRMRTAAEFRMQTNAKDFDRYKCHAAIIFSGLKAFRSGRGFGQHATFILPHGRGRIHLLSPHALDTEVANNVLLEYQEQAASGDLKFRRWPLRSHKCRGTLLTNYFSQNTGEPYQYVGGDENTVPFDSASSAVINALKLIKLRMEQASVHAPGSDFNEVLTAAYMEKQKMAFHSDSERGLGPVVASLSLGASAHMYFRLHSHFASSELGQDSSRDVLQIFLRHGDVLVMEGAGIQEYYEHTVVPLNFRIAATARFIGSDHHH